jgi:hypothetical protein
MNWIGAKQHPTQFASNKDTPGTDYASRINETHQKGYVAPLLIVESDNVPCDMPEVGTRFGYTTDMVKTYKEVTEEKL